MKRVARWATVALLGLGLLSPSCTGSVDGGRSEASARPEPAESVASLGPFDDPESAALAAVARAYPGVVRAVAETLLVFGDGMASRVEVRADHGFCVVYAPARRAGGDGWYSGGAGAPCDVLDGG